jgi:hypothetical protein
LGDEEIIDSPAFIRQRRNLILASLALVFAQTTHLTIHKLNFLGAEATIDAPVSTVPCLVVLWLYFLLRYWQQFRAVGRKPTRSRYIDIKKIYLARVATRRALDSYKQITAPTQDGKERNAWMPHDEEERTERGAEVVVVTNILDGQSRQVNITVPLGPLDLFKIRARSTLHLVITSDEITEYYVPFAIAAIPLLVALWQLCAK